MKKLFTYVSIIVGILILFFSALVLSAGHWLDLKATPQKSDYIILLAGEPLRALYAADLYNEHYARKILISRPIEEQAAAKLKELGIQLPREEKINAKILIKKKVSAKDLEFFGMGSKSTAQEAKSLLDFLSKKGLSPQTVRLLIVTSPYHTFRSKLIFSQTLQNKNITVVSTPYENFTPNWWRDQASARNVILELSKIVFYLFGGRYFA